jgi:transcriptional regulator with XRE-family HTH domain
VSLGKNLKLRRVELGIPAKELAERVGVSPSYISKIENDIVSPSLALLRKLVNELDVHYADLLMDVSPPPTTAQTRGSVSLVRAKERMTLRVPARGPIYQILSPNLQGNCEFVWIEQEPGVGGEELFGHETGCESVLVLEGVLQVDVAGTSYELIAGDCLTFDATIPHRYVNPGEKKAVWVYVAVPPSL